MTEHPDSGPADDDATALRRRELERRAFGPTSSAEQERDALAARRSLDQLAPSSSPAGPAALPALSNGAEAVQDDRGFEAGPAATHRPQLDASPRRVDLRGALPFVLVAVVALLVGGLVGRATLFPAPAAVPSSTAAPTGSPGMSITMPTIDQAAATIGQTWFSRKQQPDDRFLYYNAPHSIYQPATVRLVAAGTAVGSVYIAKRARQGAGVCLVFWGPTAKDGSQAGTMGCASTSSFLAHGIVLKLDDFDGMTGFVARWTAAALTVSPQS